MSFSRTYDADSYAIISWETAYNIRYIRVFDKLAESTTTKGIGMLDRFYVCSLNINESSRSFEKYSKISIEQSVRKGFFVWLHRHWYVFWDEIVF